MKHVAGTLFIGVLVSTGLLAQTTATRNAAADWPMYNRDLAGTRYSPLTQINTTNVARLTQTAARVPITIGGHPRGSR